MHAPPPPNSSRRLLRQSCVISLSAIGALLGACSPSSQQEALSPAPYVSPTPGTVYRYAGLSNTITAVDGWRTEYTDGRGRRGSRVALFINEDPRTPTTVDSAALATLWPLRTGNRTAVAVMRGAERYNWEFRVTDEEMVSVAAGRYATYVVQAVETPELVRDPNAAHSAIHTWWYAPELGAVVKFRSRYLSGPTAGREFGSELERVEQVQGDGGSSR